MIAFFFIEKRSEIPLINLKLAFHKIIRVGNISYLMLGVVQYIIFSTIPTLGQTPEPYRLGILPLKSDCYNFLKPWCSWRLDR